MTRLLVLTMLALLLVACAGDTQRYYRVTHLDGTRELLSYRWCQADDTGANGFKVSCGNGSDTERLMLAVDLERVPEGAGQ